VVDQTARCGDQNIHMTGQQTVLHWVRHAAQDADDLEAHVLAVLGGGIANLLRQFAGRGQYQYARAFAGQRGRRSQAVQRRQDERGGLAGACLCRGHQVVAGDDFGNGLRLNGSGFGVAGIGNRLENGGV